MKRYGIKMNIKGNLPTLIEHLRYAQLITMTSTLDELQHFVTMYCPLGRDCDHKVWQEMNIKRLASFGIQATPVVIN